jgi:hypothetical protein
MSAADLPKALARALDSHEKALERLHGKVDAWAEDELRALSARLKNRTVTIFAGNGSINIEIERRRPLTWGDTRERTVFNIWDFSGQIPWARWVEVPHFLADLEQAESESGIDFAPLGVASFRNGKRIES